MHVQDRTNLAFAALQLNRDLHFSEYVYGLVCALNPVYCMMGALKTK